VPVKSFYDLFNLAPDEAIKWFKNKGNVVSWNWFEVWQSQNAKAFTVAKSMSFDILSDVRIATEKAISQGLTKQSYRKLLEQTLINKGWWGRKDVRNPKTGLIEKVQLGSPWRLDNIYQTNMQSSMMAGRWASFYGNRNNRPYLQYITRNDLHVRPTHAYFHKKIFHIDDPIWQRIYPPNDFRCRCRVRALTEKQAFQRGFKPDQKVDMPEDFPENGFDHNVGIGQVANSIKGFKSWYKLHELKKQPFVNKQLKSYFGALVSTGIFTAFFDTAISRTKPVGEKIVTGFLNKNVFDTFRPWTGHGAIIIPDRLIPKGISETDWRLLPEYLTGNKTTEIVKNSVVITFKQRNGSKIIKLTIAKDMQIKKAEYVL